MKRLFCRAYFFLKLFSIAASCLFLSSQAGAQSKTFQVFDIWPRIGGKSFFSMDSPQGLYQYQYAFQVSNVFSWRPLDLLNPQGTVVRPVVTYYTGHFLSAGFGITDFWQLGVTLPVFSRVRFEDPLSTTSTGPTNSSHLGDLRIASKIRIIDDNRHRWGLAFEPYATIPFGADDVFMGQSTATGGVNVIGDVLLTQKVKLAINIGPEIRGEKVVINNINFNHRLVSSLGVSVNAIKNLTFSGELHASTPFDHFYSNKDTLPMEFVGGAKYDVGKTGIDLSLGGGSCVVCGAGGAKARVFFNIGYRHMNATYLLKEQEEEKMKYITLSGKSAEERLATEIYELAQKCPLDPKKYKVDRDDPNCHEIYELQEIAKTCPAPEQFDPSRDDPKCRTVYILRQHDTDKDGIPDVLDWCPTEPGKGAEKGCPHTAYVVINPEKGEIITKSIHFEYKSATVRDESKPILETLTTALRSQPAIQKILIKGYTDNVGTPESNLELSSDRSKAVYDYLVGHGINAERLHYQGFGQTDPVADNETPEGRAKNRRVEFIIEEVGSF